MDPVVVAALGIVMRWTHVLSVITMLGGLLYLRVAVAPSLAALPSESGAQFAVGLNARFAPWLRLAVILAVISGLYNLMAKSNIPPGYHLWFGLKMLFVLHIAVESFLLSRTSVTQVRRNRMVTGVLIAGMIVVLLSGYLRFLSNWMMS